MDFNTTPPNVSIMGNLNPIIKYIHAAVSPLPPDADSETVGSHRTGRLIVGGAAVGTGLLLYLLLRRRR